MIDTPGHTDFSYEVSRSLAACEGAILLVDATRGPQAQTVAHFEKAQHLGLSVIGVINKIDSPLARVGETEREMRMMGIGGEILKISALTGEGVELVLEAVVKNVPAPRGEHKKPFRALVFDSIYDDHLGIVAYICVVDGELEIKTSGAKQQVEFLGAEQSVKVREIGYFVPERTPSSHLGVGEVGYLATGIKDPQVVMVGDTVASSGKVKPLPGYEESQSFVFASFFPATGDFEELKGALNRLRLEEPAVSVEEISSPAFGRGLKLGFLGEFHLEIVKERLRREFDLALVVTKPAVAFPDLEREPWIKMVVITPPPYLAKITKLVNDQRGEVGEVVGFGSKIRLSAKLPLMEFFEGLHDRLKSISSGYASLDWEFIGYRPAKLVRLDINIHGQLVGGLSEIVLKKQAWQVGREKVRRLKKVMPREQFAYALQAKVGGKVIAREDIPALRKDVTAPLYGGDVTRKRKLLKKQKKGKKLLAKHGHVSIPPAAFLI